MQQQLSYGDTCSTTKTRSKRSHESVSVTNKIAATVTVTNIIAATVTVTNIIAATFFT